ncbi:hypothetical protein DFJ73DRAFT_535723 [Zopfochytrium polystomum]|nr:hypothetical protein DFJ73DRAFT_535723 [Zopfochytrium polystomum]
MLASLQKRVALFLLRRAIGQFLQSDLDPASLDVQLLGRGCVVLKDLELNLNVLNELLRSTPVRVTQGFVGQITATIPWRDLWSGLCSLELSDVKIGLTLTDDLGVSETSAAEETPILSSSIHFAGDFLRSDISDDEELDLPSGGANSRSGRKDVEGVQLLAKLIDHVMSTLGFSIRNLEVSFSASAEDSKKLVFFLPSVSYGDETAKEGSGGVSGVLASFATKSVAISGFSFKLVDENVGSSADKYALLLSSPYSDENSATIRVRQDIGEPLEETMYATASENLARSLHSAKNKSRPTWDIVVDFATIHSAIRVEDIAGLISFVTGIQPSAKVEVTPSIESKPPCSYASFCGVFKAFFLDRS